MLILKAMIYVTSPQGVLVFEEPASPHIGLQVPGGTIEQGEDTLLAAERELFEETGLTLDQPLRLLGSIDFMLQEDGKPLSCDGIIITVRLKGIIRSAGSIMKCIRPMAESLFCSGCFGCRSCKQGNA